MKSILFLSMSLLLMLSVLPVQTLNAQGDVTTVILVRHAEKVDDSRDPELSEAGKVRAHKLAELLGSQSIDAMYSTDYIRTRETCGPVAAQKGVEVKLYDPRDMQQVDAMVSGNAGKTILICGHSNSTPRLANHLLKQQQFADFDESDYGNILIVSIPGSGAPSVVHLRY